MPVAVEEKSEVKNLKAQVAELKQKVSELDNARNKLSMDLGAAHKDVAAYKQLQVAHEALETAYALANSKISHLEADLNSQRSKGSRDGEVVAAAKQLVDAIKKLS